MEPASLPFYLDWSFWAVFVAAIAVILSQLQPLHKLFQKPKLDFEVYSKISISHKIGNPNLQMHLSIGNTGNKQIRIKNIVAEVSRNDQLVASLPAQSYLFEESDENPKIFTNFALQEDREWSHIVNFLNDFSYQEEKYYRQIEDTIKSDIKDRIEPSEFDNKPLVASKPEYVEPFMDFFNKKFIWLTGEYDLKMYIQTDNDSSDINKSFRFTIFESHEKDLVNQTKGYIYGDGIFWNSVHQHGIRINLKLLS